MARAGDAAPDGEPLGFPPLPADPHGDEPAYDAEERAALSPGVVAGGLPELVELVARPDDGGPRWRLATRDEDVGGALAPEAAQVALGALADAHPAVEPLLRLGEPGRFVWDAGYEAFVPVEGD